MGKDTKLISEAYESQRPDFSQYDDMEDEHGYAGPEDEFGAESKGTAHAYIQDETSPRPKRVEIENNGDGTMTLRFDNSYTISKASIEDINSFISVMQELIQ